jgi:hypothetical protein
MAVAIHGKIIFFVAIRGTIIFLVAIRGSRFAMVHGTYLSAVCHNKGKSSTSHFTSTVSLFAAPYLFVARLYMCKTYTGPRRIV